jgi:GNAT acetyltransferase-like protein
LIVSEVTTTPEFLTLEDEWNALASATGAELFLHHEFLRIWIDNFHPRSPIQVLIGREDGELVAALALLRQRGTIFGAPTRQLVSFANDHTPRFDLLARDPPRAARAFFAHLKGDGAWHFLRINQVVDGSNAWHLLHAAREAGFPVGSWLSVRSPFVPLSPSVDQFEGRLHRKFQANIRRRRKKLQGRGTLTFERVDGGDRLPLALEEGMAVERSGWKGEIGSAISQDLPTWGFYSELARNAAYRDWLSLYLLRLDGRPVAFHFGLSHGRRYYLLKTAYDESMRDTSPGQLICEEVMRDCVRRGIGEFDFLGPDMPWKREWTGMLRPHYWLFVFRNSPYGQALHRYKFKWIPAVKNLLRRNGFLEAPARGHG